MMTYDCFTYWNEDDLLYFRIKHLWDYVDKFVIVESDVTHRGHPKDWGLEKLLQDKLSWAREKIIYVKKKIDVSSLDLSHRSDKYDPNSPFWKIENLQRNAILEGLYDATEEDIIIIGDLDEFPTHAAMKMMPFLTTEFSQFSMGMRIFNYYLNVEQDVSRNFTEVWIGSVIGRMKNLTTPQDWRNRRHFLPWQSAMGYHFSWLGEDNVRIKLKNTSHDEVEQLVTEENIRSCFYPDSHGIFGDIFGREKFIGRVSDIDNDPNYPRCIINEAESIQHLIYK